MQPAVQFLPAISGDECRFIPHAVTLGPDGARPSGGTGRRAGLKIRWGQPHVSSILSSGIRPTRTTQRGEGRRKESHMSLAIPLLLGGLLAGGSATPPTHAPVDDPCWTRAAPAELSLRASALDSTVARLGDAAIKVCYSRPSARGRVIMGGLVPFGEPWRLGANEATTLHVPVAIRFGDVTLKPGLYSLYAIPGPKTWQIVVNESATRWGIPINAAVRAHDVGAVSATSERTAAPVETLTL